jgi:hypothetical protein
MHTVIETQAYLRAADQAGMTEEERELAVIYLGGNLEAGDVMKETGGSGKCELPGKEKARAADTG